MKILFCADPLNSSYPDEAYQAEVKAANALSLGYGVINYEALVNDNNPTKAVRQLPKEPSNTFGIYRGWMLTPNQYSQLYNALADKGIVLINDPVAYTHCHYLPESYSLIEAYTPASVWLRISNNSISIEKVMDILKPFSSKPVIVKDFVKSQKHYWDEACFIPSASNRKAVERVVKRFIDLQGEYINEGLVFREFIEFEPLTNHSKSRMPLTKEFRIFIFDGSPFYLGEYWEEGNYGEDLPPIEQFQDVMSNIRSRFFTIDVAKRKDGKWMIVELGDGQVAGVPKNIDVQQFYKALHKQLLKS
ncbi:ATP-grasp domain-containing protein [Cyanobacteria bacterium FACHB-472]|nr:ATP-grasp domain-containing protein [Cyanobacteria bacterium FACHB-472]